MSGCFEAAHSGTLSLNEVGDVSPTLHGRLPRVRQARDVRRVCETRLRKVDVHLIAATHRDLAAQMSQARVRQDLYDRWHVVHVLVHPLRERVGGVGALMKQLLGRVASRMGRPMRGYMEAARQLFIGDAWRGNVRELEHALEHACAVAEPPLIDVGDLPEAIQRGLILDPPAGRSRPLREMEREYVQLIVERHRGDRRRAAEDLQLSLATLKRTLIESQR